MNDLRFAFVRISKCLGGIRISNLHRGPRCHYLLRSDAVGTLVCIDLAVLPSEMVEAMTLCKECHTPRELDPKTARAVPEKYAGGNSGVPKGRE